LAKVEKEKGGWEGILALSSVVGSVFLSSFRWGARVKREGPTTRGNSKGGDFLLPIVLLLEVPTIPWGSRPFERRGFGPWGVSGGFVRARPGLRSRAAERKAEFIKSP